jgi:hypothetical protein
MTVGCGVRECRKSPSWSIVSILDAGTDRGGTVCQTLECLTPERHPSTPEHFDLFPSRGARGSVDQEAGAERGTNR